VHDIHQELEFFEVISQIQRTIRLTIAVLQKIPERWHSV